MSTGTPLFTVGPPPHWRAESSITRMNYAYILALLPAAGVGCIAYGFGPEALQSLGVGTGVFSRALGFLVRELGIPVAVFSMIGAMAVVALGMGTGILAEYAVQILFRQPYHVTNGHGALMGLIIGVMMPPTVPWWVVVVGVTIAIVVGKQIYGGIGAYPFHPAMIGWMILLLSWQNHIYPVGMDSIAAQHEVVIFFTFLGGIMLVALGHVRWQIPLGVILGVALSTPLFHLAKPELAGPLAQLATGNVMLAAFFISSDSTCSPVNHAPMLIYGVFTGAMIMLIRTFGVWPDAVPFAVLLMNVASPLLDKIHPRPVKVVIQHG
ncbi:MAG TPA: RnfABCDGE type electron transport complex subunit D [bacterium]|nr:RnfABCDGE type electron transport complex subunit D [bacterium]